MARTSLITFDTRARERFGNLAAHVRLHACSDAEARDVMRLVEAVKLGQVAVGDAHATLAGLRHEQSQRRAA
jgi:hypothetical protein